jgi:hypothetical protein
LPSVRTGNVLAQRVIQQAEPVLVGVLGGDHPEPGRGLGTAQAGGIGVDRDQVAALAPADLEAEFRIPGQVFAGCLVN